MYEVGLAIGVLAVAALMAGGSIHDVLRGRESLRAAGAVYALSVAVLGGFVAFCAIA